MLKQHLESALETSRQPFQSFAGTLRNLQEWESESHPLVRLSAAAESDFGSDLASHERAVPKLSAVRSADS